MKRNRSMILAFTLPATLLFIAVFVYPIIRTVIMSFFRIVEITDPVSRWEFRGLGNYIDLFNASLFRQSLTGNNPDKRNKIQGIFPGSNLPA